MSTLLKHFCRGESGSTPVEGALMMALITGGIVCMMTQIGVRIHHVSAVVSLALGDANVAL